MDMFEKQRLERFIGRLCADLVSALPSTPQAYARRTVEVGIRTAGALGLTRQCDVARFVLLIAVHGGGFDEPPLPKLGRCQEMTH